MESNLRFLQLEKSPRSNEDPEHQKLNKENFF